MNKSTKIWIAIMIGIFLVGAVCYGLYMQKKINENEKVAVNGKEPCC